MRQLFLGISAAALFFAAGVVVAQTPPSESKQVQTAVAKPVETATSAEFLNAPVAKALGSPS